MNIRLLTASDAESYWELRVQALKQSPEAFLMTYEEELHQENPINKYAQTLQSESRYTYGVFNGEELIGVGTLQVEKPLKIRHKANILAMYVSQNHRGSSIGKTLMRHLIEKAKSLELEQLHLTVVSNNHTAEKLYSSLGFCRYGLEEKALKLNEQYWDEEHMVLFL
ncbi:GNAT family N-acetyltransferase [Solibacillus sp. FSL H8-0538]|uniref:GNAT family N-acetyltransferase n=1 Tax=Solibacillus sp. FSL H8-0538 TaxID=2921400 RepID=UPI0030F702B4